MALNKVIQNERKENVSYWKIRDYHPNTIANQTDVTLCGYISYEDRVEFLTMPKAYRKYTFDKVIETLAEVYTAIKETEEFLDATDC